MIYELTILKESLEASQQLSESSSTICLRLTMILMPDSKARHGLCLLEEVEDDHIELSCRILNLNMNKRENNAAFTNSN